MLAITETKNVLKDSTNNTSFLLEVRQQLDFIMFACETPYTEV